MLTLSKIKNFPGMEHSGFSCLVLIDGKVVAEAIDYGTGGGLDLKVLKQEDQVRVHEAMVEAFHAAKPDAETVKLYASDMVMRNGYANEELAYNVIVGMISDIEFEKKLKRDCKKHVLIKKADGDMMIFHNKLYNPLMDAQLEAKWPGCEVINKRYL